VLNRKTSNYIFYGTLVLILISVFLIRSFALSTLNSNITSVTNSNRNLQSQIDGLKDVVQENKDTETDYVFELYRSVPATYDQTRLENYTISQLELIGITEENVLARSVTPSEENISFPEGSIFAPLLEDFKVVEVSVYYNTPLPASGENDDLSTEELIEKYINPFIDSLHDAEQMFIVNNIEYYSPVDSNFIGVTINFLTFYEKVEEES